MSDCSTRAWLRPDIPETEWHTPQGNGVHAHMEPIFAVFHFTDGSDAERTFSREVNGVEREIDWIEADGVAFRRAD